MLRVAGPHDIVRVVDWPPLVLRVVSGILDVVLHIVSGVLDLVLHVVSDVLDVVLRVISRIGCAAFAVQVPQRAL